MRRWRAESPSWRIASCARWSADSKSSSACRAERVLFVLLVYGGPGAMLGFLVGHTALLIAFFDMVGLAFLFGRMFARHDPNSLLLLLHDENAQAPRLLPCCIAT